MVSFIKNYDAYPDTLTVWQVAVILHVQQATVRQLIHRKALRAYRVGRSYIVDKSDLREFIRLRSTIRRRENGNQSDNH